MKGMHLLVTLILGVATAATEPAPALLGVEPARTLPVQHDGRIMPLDTLAHRAVERITGSRYCRSIDPVAIVFSWVFEPKKWLEAPIIKIDSRALADVIKVTPIDGRASYKQLAASGELGQLLAQARLGQEQEQTLSRLQEQALALQERISVFGNLIGGAGLPLVPHGRDVQAPWMSPALMHGYADEQTQQVQQAWQHMAEAFLLNQAGAFAKACVNFRQQVAHLPDSGYVVGRSMHREVIYNHLMPVRLAWMLMLAAAILGLMSHSVHRRWFDALAILVQVVGFSILTIGLLLRWDIAGHIPATNFYESLVLLGWGVGASSLISLVVLGDRTLPLNAAVLAGLFLALADLLPIDPWIRPIAPVLRNTVWMSIHVPIIMLGYAILAQAVILGHIQVGVLAFGRSDKSFSNKLDWQLYWCLMAGSLLLLVGILTGSMWANSSWGRYWGWDPKEVWSLAAFLGYMALLHARRKGFVGPFGTAAWSVAAIWLIVGTYLVVNFVLPIGLHSYASGSSEIVTWLALVATAEATFVAACYLRYARRRADTQPA